MMPTTDCATEECITGALSAIHFQLSLTGSSQTYSPSSSPACGPACLTSQVCPRACEAWESVLVLCQFHLESALVCVGMLREDVQNQGSPVKYLHSERALQVAELAW